MVACCPKGCGGRMTIWRMLCVILGGVGAGFANICLENSTWTSQGLALNYVCYDASSRYHRIIKSKGLACPSVSMELYFIAFNYTCVLITLVFIFLACCVDFKRAEVIDLGFQIISLVGYLIGGVMYLVSTEQIYVLYKNVFPNYVEFEEQYRLYKVVGGVFGLLAACAYAIVAGLVFKTYRRIAKPTNVEDAELTDLNGLESNSWFRITLNKDGIYFPGENVDGQVVLNLSKGLSVQAISIELKGRGQVCWTQMNAGMRLREYYQPGFFRICCGRWKRKFKGKLNSEELAASRELTLYNSFYPKTFTKEECYISENINLIGSSNEEFNILREGMQAYNFSFCLPQNVPESFKCRSGYVEYFLLGRVSNGKRDELFKLPLTVKAKVDLNLNSEALVPQNCELTKCISFFGWKKGEINLKASIEKSAFVPKERIDFQVEIRNNSNRPCSVYASLYKILEFKTQDRNKVDEDKIYEVMMEGQVKPGQYEMWNPHNFPFPYIPNLPPTGLGGNGSLINVRYELRFELRVFGLIRQVCEKIPIFIGTIPRSSN